MERCFALAIILGVVCLCSVRAAAGSGLLAVPKDFPKIELTFDAGGQELKWVCDPQKENQSSVELNGCSLGVKIEEKGIQRILRFNLQAPTGEKLSVKSYTAKVILPTEGLHAVMVPNTRILAHTLIYYHEHHKWPENVPLTRCLVPEDFGEAACANSEAPFILLTDNKGRNAFAVGWAVADTASMLNGQGEGNDYVLTLSRQNDTPFTGEALEDALIISSAAKPWQDVELAYAKTFDKFNGRAGRPAAPAWTSEPVFCTWYCYLDHIDQEGVLKIARKCKELGFGTILIDAGWDCRPDGGYGDFENGILGDFEAQKDRFPDLPGAVRQMHDMGLRVELWSAPFWQGKKSRVYQEKTKDWHARTAEGESRDLCPKYPGTRQFFKEQYQRVARTYGIDGMWFDGADGVPPSCASSHQHLDQPMGDAFVDCLAAAREGLRSVNPEAITEVRVLHGNLNSKRAIDIVQPSDAPESFEMLRLAGIHLRPWTYDIVLKNDPMIWEKDADAATVGKFLATMVCNGVPALSVDFLTASEEQCKITKAWLAFYKEHKRTLLKGEFKLFGADYTHPDMMLIGDKEAVVYVQNSKTDEVLLPKSIERVTLLNCTNSDKLNLKIAMAKGKCVVQPYGPDWSPTGAPVSVANIGAGTELSVPRGGAVVIE
ncbi:MAG: alpha-galactosidase [Armatimonadota bacterium]|nr:alpha-galactosidase [Armatimonadota bacterium]